MAAGAEAKKILFLALITLAITTTANCLENSEKGKKLQKMLY